LDITGITVNEKVIKMPSQSDFAGVIKKAEDAAAEMLDNYLKDYSRLLGIGFSIPGLVDIKTHDIVLAPNLGWENSNVYSALGRFKEVPVFVENEAMASAICENWLGQCQNEENFVCINVKSGIGAGIYAGGRLYRGASGTAGEVGHILVDENGPKCGCGSYGCLETVASSKSIVDKAKRLVKQGTVSTLNNLENADEMTISDVVAAADAGDEAARTVIIEAARYMGIAVSNIVNTINPSKIVLGKEFLKYADMAIETIKGVVSCKALGTPASRVEIVASGIGEKVSAMGAAIIPLKALFKYNL
jgi:predicted NBD/HSP70 family sugar kinase